MNITKKTYISLDNIFFYSYLIILFVPKVDIIDVPGFWQGIRLEDLILFGYALYIIYHYKEKIINNYLVQKFLPLLYYFLIIFIASYVGKISGSKIAYLTLIRVLEYSFLIILLCNIKINRDQILIFIKFYVLINFIFVILQKFSLVGSFTSLGYLGPDHQLSTRVMGLSGGSWELGVIMAMCYFIVVKFERPSFKTIIFYFLLILYINLEAQSRINFIGFILANIFFLKEFLNTRKFIGLISIILFSLILSIFFVEFLDISSFQRLINTNYLQSLGIIKNFFLFLDLPDRNLLDTSVWSLWYRLSLWLKIIPDYFNNFFTILFGAGNYIVYYESGILRIIFTTGIIGLLYVIYTARKLEVYILVYFVTIGLTLDIFNSFKIYNLTILYYKLIYENYSYRRY